MKIIENFICRWALRIRLKRTMAGMLAHRRKVGAPDIKDALRLLIEGRKEMRERET